MIASVGQCFMLQWLRTIKYSLRIVKATSNEQAVRRVFSELRFSSFFVGDLILIDFFLTNVLL